MLSDLIKVDLHIHSSISAYKEDCDNAGHCCVTNSTVNNLDKLFKKIDAKRINLIAFSDHNRFDKQIFLKAHELIDSNKYVNIKGIVPSVEFDVKIEDNHQPCHILTVFDFTCSSDLDKIYNAIEKDKLIGKNDFYDRQRFEALLRNIGLSVLLIACQRKGFDNRKIGQRDLSDSCNNPIEFIKTGYIDALEYQSNAVEGILLNTLSEFPKDMGVSLVAGSDCHDWDYYPLHSKNATNNNKAYCFTIKALPTFKGLLLSFTSPATRFKRVPANNSYIKTFIINGITYNLSPGFNAIIGENGSCKSTLLEGLSKQTSKNYMKQILKANDFKCDFDQCDLIKYIYQGRLTDCSQTNSELFKDEMAFKHIDNNEFETAVKNVYTAIQSKIESNIKLNAIKNEIKTTTFTFDLDIEQNRPFFIQIDITNAFTSNNNKYKDSYANIRKVLIQLAEEHKNKLYSDSQKDRIKKAFSTIKSVYVEIQKSYLQIEREIRIKNAMFSLINDYNRTIKSRSTTASSQKNNYLRNKKNLINIIVNLIREERTNKLINIPNIKLSETSGIIHSPYCGFDFITTAKYHEVPNLNAEFYKEVFNSDYQEMNKVIQINQTDLAMSAIKGTIKDRDYNARLMKNANSFISKFILESYDVADGGTKIRKGSTLGEKSIVFYKFVSNKMNRNAILLIDQPEDNISNLKIKEELINYLNDLRDRFQIIFVTHNPLLVINLDVDNVIYLEHHNDAINIIDGCLEEDDILKLIANHMDGGKDAIKRRLKVYGN